ncbi:MAG: MoaD/ThiS family protein [Pseudomonadota bacterium]
MKTINVRYFALFRERAGRDAETVETAADDALALFRQLTDRHGTDDPRGHCKVAINDVMADWDSPVADGDEVLLFPPVAGG